MANELRKLGVVLATRKSFLLRLDPQLYQAIKRWADDDLRSVNGQVEFLLRRALDDAGRLPKKKNQQKKEDTNQPEDTDEEG